MARAQPSRHEGVPSKKMNEFRLITHPLRNLAELDAQLYTEKSAYLRSRPEPKPGIGTYTKFRTLPFFAPVISEFSVRLFPVIVRTI